MISRVAIILTVINILLCLLSSYQLYSSGEPIGYDNSILVYFIYKCVETLLYKVSIVVIAISFLVFFVSYVINTTGLQRKLMLTFKVIQTVVGLFLLCNYIFLLCELPLLFNFNILIISVVIIIALEFGAYFLYLRDRKYKKIFFEIVRATVLTFGSGALIWALLMYKIIRILMNIFMGGGEELIYNRKGQVIGSFFKE